MESVKTTLNEYTASRLVVSAGCPYSDWEMAFPALEELGLEPPGDQYFSWLGRSFSKAGIELSTAYKKSLNPLANDLDFVGSDILLSDSRNLWLLDFWAENFTEARFILFYTTAETALTSALKRGINPDAFMTAWSQANRKIVSFQRRYRDRAILFNAESAFYNSSDFAEACRSMGLSGEMEVEPKLVSKHKTNDSIERLIAGQYLADAQDSLTLQLEMEASATPLAGNARSDSLHKSVLVEAYLQKKSRETQLSEELAGKEIIIRDFKSQLKTASESQDESIRENGFLALQLDQIQEELESALNANQKLKQKKLKLESNFVDSEQKLKAAHKNISDEKMLIKDKNSELFEVRNTLDGKTKDFEDAQKRLNLSLSDIKKLETEKRDGDQESDFLLLQLHQVQEELSYYSLKYQEINQKNIVPEIENDEVDANTSQEDKSNDIIESRRSSSQNIKLSFTRKSKGKRTKHKAKTRANKIEQEKVSLIKRSGLFDENWYMAEYPDVAQAGLDPVKHYLRYGADEDRDPSTKFSTGYYLGSNPDIPKAEINPLIHYIRFGRDEGRVTINHGFSH